MLRVISGSARGRHLEAPPGEQTRPILDRQKQSLFNILSAHFPCEGVLDVFAGSGSLGIEALSRGAERGTFVENGAHALPVLRRNLSALGFLAQAKVIVRSAFDVVWEGLEHRVDVAFVDPPFPLVEADPDSVLALILAVFQRAPVGPDFVAVFRARVGSPLPSWPSGVGLADHRVMGESDVYFLAKSR